MLVRKLRVDGSQTLKAVKGLLKAAKYQLKAKSSERLTEGLTCK